MTSQSPTPSSIHRLRNSARPLSRSLRSTALFFKARIWIWPIIAFVMLTVLGLWVRREVERPIEAELPSELQAILNADVAALRLWIAFQEEKITEVAANPLLAEAMAALLPHADDPSALHQSPALAALRQRFEERGHDEGYHGFAVFDRNGRILASDLDELIGKTPYDVTGDWLAKALGGAPAVSRPFASRILLSDLDGAMRTGIPTMFVAGPVRDDGEAQIGVIALRIRPEVDFTRILQIAQMGDTGETYAIDENGLLLSQSRFDDELKQIGLLTDNDESKSILAVEIRDPGVDMAAGERPALRRGEQPLTLMAQEVIAGRSGYNVKGYRDYRGVPVVGAWTWLDDYGVGVATEIDVAEAYRPVYALRSLFWALYAMLALASVAIFVFTIMVARANREARRAALEAKRLGQYTLGDKIGAGGMGVVYRAHHDMLRRPTAVKLLEVDRTTPESTARFEREVQLTSQLSHPNTIMIYDYGRTPEGVFFYAMEHLDGFDLETMVREFGPIEEGRAAQILRQVCGSLNEAHQAGLIHRDIKPANIVLIARGGLFDMVKVLDFGLVKAIDADRASGLTAEDTMAGTPAYLSPEAINAPATIGPAADIYAVGAVGYFLVTGSVPFPGGSINEVLSRHLLETVESPSQRIDRPISPEFEKIIIECLAKDPASRPPSAAELARRLAACACASEWTEEKARAWWAAHGPQQEHHLATGPSSTASLDTVLMDTPPAS